MTLNQKIKLDFILILIVMMGLATDLMSQQPFVCQGQYYLSLTPPQASFSQLYNINTTRAGNTVTLDPLSSNLTQIVNGMGYRVTDNFIYGVNPFTAVLSRIGADGIAVPLGIPRGIPRMPVYFAGDVSPDGKFLILIGSGNFRSELVKVDLEDPNYQVQIVPLQRNAEIFDVAFDPFSGLLYGYDALTRRLVIIDPDSGAINSNFVNVPEVPQLGALFFDSFGNLYGYGASDEISSDKVVGINKSTGAIRILAFGPPTDGQDACACPYTIELQKTVIPDTAFQCTEVVYNFIVSNGSGATRFDINLRDELPIDLIPQRVLVNPFGGIVNIRGNTLTIDGMSVPVGIDTIKLVAEVGPNAEGDYANQASLTGLPVSLGASVRSDNPFTFVEEDSTWLHVLPRDFSFIQDTLIACQGESVDYDIDRQGLTYLWSDGSTMSNRVLDAGQTYGLTVSDVCEDFVYDIVVDQISLSVDILSGDIEIALGESFSLTSEYTNDDDQVVFQWSASQDGEFSCDDCQDTDVFSLRDEYIYLTMTNADGCQVDDSLFVRVARTYEADWPNIITANGDNFNDIFSIWGNEEIAQGLNLYIYDRWGNLVFQSDEYELNEPTSGWDGTFNGQFVSPGVYAFTTKLRFIDGEERIFSGDLTIVR